MYCKKITYTDFDGNVRTEEHYFNLTEAELIEWLMAGPGYTLDKVLDNMTKKLDTKGIMDAVKDLIYKSYGEKSLDGRRFVKNHEVKANFMETNAYSVLFVELATDAEKAAEFFNGIIPKDLASKVDQMTKANPNASPDEIRQLINSENKQDNLISMT